MVCCNVCRGRELSITEEWSKASCCATCCYGPVVAGHLILGPPHAMCGSLTTQVCSFQSLLPEPGASTTCSKTGNSGGAGLYLSMCCKNLVSGTQTRLPISSPSVYLLAFLRLCFLLKAGFLSITCCKAGSGGCWDATRSILVKTASILMAAWRTKACRTHWPEVGTAPRVHVARCKFSGPNKFPHN